MTDWTTIATAAIAGAAGRFGAGLGFLGARLQVTAESERMKGQLAEAHLQQRQGVYHNFLDSAYRFHGSAGAIEPFDNLSEYHEWARSFEHYLTGVSLFGTEEAWHAAQELADVIGEAMGATPRYSGEIEDKFLLTWKTVINAMRPDTAPVRLER